MDAVEAGRLIAYALDRRMTPGNSGDSGDYRTLLEEYVNDARSRQLVDDILEGAGCEVAHAGLEEGMIVRSKPDGPWAWPSNADDLPWNKKKFNKNLSAADRAARMAVVPALLAYVAPSAADLDDLLSRKGQLSITFSALDLEQFIRELALDLENQDQGGDSPGEERPLWWHWIQPAGNIPTPKRVSPAAMLSLVNEVLTLLQAEGLLAKVSGSSAATTVYRPRRRLLFHYRDLMIDDLFLLMRHFAARRPDTTAPEPPSASGSTES